MGLRDGVFRTVPFGSHTHVRQEHCMASASALGASQEDSQTWSVLPKRLSFFNGGKSWRDAKGTMHQIRLGHHCKDSSAPRVLWQDGITSRTHSMYEQHVLPASQPRAYIHRPAAPGARTFNSSRNGTTKRAMLVRAPLRSQFPTQKRQRRRGMMAWMCGEQRKESLCLVCQPLCLSAMCISTLHKCVGAAER